MSGTPTPTPSPEAPVSVVKDAVELFAFPGSELVTVFWSRTLPWVVTEPLMERIAVNLLLTEVALRRRRGDQVERFLVVGAWTGTLYSMVSTDPFLPGDVPVTQLTETSSGPRIEVVPRHTQGEGWRTFITHPVGTLDGSQLPQEWVHSWVVDDTGMRYRWARATEAWGRAIDQAAAFAPLSGRSSHMPTVHHGR